MSDTFSRGQVVWILRHLSILEEGCLPIEYSSYTDMFRVKKGGGWASFENPAGLAATITKRLEDYCGFDGALVYLCYCFGRDWMTVARITGVDFYDMKKRMNKAIDYISGEWPKKRTYLQYKGHRKGGDAQ